ncbi:MAG: gamma-glutamylcyclotransferase [Marivita sp.]|uniref:gamma-glutamylcyclotransferase family protein n=1 Tax=Marivita sp. TaxID=2003365 RepID=UPI001B2DE28F|nr:gamma-glutamylcyclotransferase family protein [Marivita sp.]MBO6882126.1 gamma-glutamylcyclotransferase [Marivita sp.]
MKHLHFFGYGSLVNRNTHSFTPIHASQIAGWRRIWQRAPNRPAAFLSVIVDSDSVIDGVIAPVPNHDWVALDAREFSYARLAVTDAVRHAATDVRDISIYAIPPGDAAPPDKDHPILLSYVDAVLQGYLREFGEAGAERFCTTTEGWDTPVRNDRADPIYPRAQRLTQLEQTFVDDMLLTLRAKVFA